MDTAEDAGIKEQALQRGSEVTYVNEEFLRTKLGGLLDVYVKGCTGLPAVDVRRAWGAVLHETGAALADSIRCRRCCCSSLLLQMWPGSSNPYAIATIGDGSVTTPVVKGSLDPAWDTVGHLYVHNPAQQRLSVKVLSVSGLPGSSHKLLGTALRGLADVCDGQAHDASIVLRGGESGAGGKAQVHLAFQFRPFTGGAPGRREAAEHPAPSAERLVLLSCS